MEVRQATASDVASIAPVDVESWRAAYREVMPTAYLDSLSIVEREQGFARAIERQQQRGRRVLVAEDDARVGYAALALWLGSVGFGVHTPDVDRSPKPVR